MNNFMKEFIAIAFDLKDFANLQAIIGACK
jgi:hypothetical protein